MSALGFDPWTATEAEARAMALLAGDDPLTLCLVNGRGSLLALQQLPASSPLSRWCAATRLIDRRASIETGDGLAVLAAVDLCATHQLQVPQWLALAYRRVLGPVLAGQAGTAAALQALGGQAHGGCAAARAAQDRRALCRVWSIVRRFRWQQQGPSVPELVLWQAFSRAGQAAARHQLDAELQQAVRACGVGRTKARRLFDEAVHLLGPPAWKLQQVPPPLL